MKKKLICLAMAGVLCLGGVSMTPVTASAKKKSQQVINVKKPKATKRSKKSGKNVNEIYWNPAEEIEDQEYVEICWEPSGKKKNKESNVIIWRTN